MPHPAQQTNKIKIDKLKGLSNLELDFGDKPLTAIMGVNGCGKTTVLHALACCYQPYTGQGSTDYTFSEFFTPNSDSRWNGSKFNLDFQHDLVNGGVAGNRVYKKDNQRWSPRYATRLSRWVNYIGIRDSVPAIEQLRTKSFVTLTRTNRVGNIANLIRINASYILNREYTIISTNTRGNSSYIGVQCKGINYSAISMGSGEQRIFKILEQLYNAPDYGLILIDEIELLLHSDSLKRLIVKLDEVARAKHLQIIFTTHSEILLEMKNRVNIRHVFIAEDGNAYCLKDTNPKLFYQLTGNQQKPISIFVEDDLSKEIVMKIAGQLGIRQHIKIDSFGPAINCFTTAAGAVLNGVNTNHTLFVIDGDLYKTSLEKKQRIDAVLTGTDIASRRKKVQALKSISEFTLPANTPPEQYFHAQIVGTNPVGLQPEYAEIRDAAVGIQAVDNTHKFIDDMVAKLGYPTNDYRAIVDFLATLPFWTNYIQPIHDWLNNKIAELHL